MGRKPTRNLNLPKGMRARYRKKGKVYYFFDHGGKPRRETSLGTDYIEAIRKWAELGGSDTPQAGKITFDYAAERYTREVIPGKNPSTQYMNLRELKKLKEFFNNPPAHLDDIEPVHISQYLDWRGQSAKTRANREKALFSHIWNYCRQWGYTAKTNPCQGIKGHKERPREMYITDAAFNAVWEQADESLQDALDLALSTGQRPADVLSMTETDIRDGAIWVKQKKTGKRLRIAIEGKLKAILERINNRKQAHSVRSLKLLVDIDGTPLTVSKLRTKFEKAREASGQEWQFRDLRAKAGTDADILGGLGAARDLLGHTTEQMTTAYIRHRAGKLVKPTN